MEIWTCAQVEVSIRISLVFSLDSICVYPEGSVSLLFLLLHWCMQREHGDFGPAVEADLRAGGAQATVGIQQHIVDL